MNLLLIGCLAGVTIAGVLAVAKALTAGSLADRIVALDLFLGIIVTGIAIGVVTTGDGLLLNLLVITALIGFVSTVTVARFLEGRGVRP